MQTRYLFHLAAVLLSTVFISSTLAQGTASTYQGQLTDRGAPASGSYDLTFTLYDDPTGGAQWFEVITNTAVVVSNGLFTTLVDFGADPFDGTARWLEIAVATNGSGAFSPLAPRQPLTPTPYALHASNAGSAGQADTALGVAPNAVTVTGILDSTITAAKIADGQVVKGLNNLHDQVTLAAGDNLTLTPGGQTLTLATPTDWHLGGNVGTVAGTHFLGTADDQPLELKVNNQRGLRLEHTSGAFESVNLTGGWTENSIADGTTGATIAGGGRNGLPNTIGTAAHYSTIGGGRGQGIGVDSWFATIAGGRDNSIGTNSSSSAIGGGYGNAATGEYAVVVGGLNNAAGAIEATVGGGGDNEASGAGSTIGGGSGSLASGNESTVGGGNGNTASGFRSTIGGGAVNVANQEGATVAGGEQNRATGLFASVGGGYANKAEGPGAFVGGGGYNGSTFHPNTARGAAASICGGEANTIQTNADDSTIGGGDDNQIQTGAECATIGGGRYNEIQTNADYATIGGGLWNTAQADAIKATIGGGDGNWIGSNATYSAIGGGGFNRIESHATNATISGGWDNIIYSFAVAATIGGGQYNHIHDRATGAAIGGGHANWIHSNAYSATISGGFINEATNFYATVPGGWYNLAGGFSSLAAGTRAKALHDGAFVWADSTFADFASTSSNQFLIRANGGVGIGTTSPQQQLDVDGGDIRVRGPDGFNAPNEEARLLLGDGNHYIKGIYAGGVRIGTYPVGDAVYITEAGDGRVGIGRLPTTYKLEVEGDASKTSAGSWLANSDRRIKTDISPITNALERLDRVRLVSFRYTPEYRAQHPSIEDRPYINVVAQEFARVFPDSVKPSGDRLPDGDPILSVDTYPLTIYSAAAVQELYGKLRAQNAELKQELASQLQQKQAEIAELRTELEQLKRLVTALTKKSVAP